MADLAVMERAQDPKAYEACREAAGSNDDRHPVYGEFGRRYYPAALADGYSDSSFVVAGDGRAVAVVECGRDGTRLSYFGFPIRIRMIGDDMNGPARKARALAIRHLQALCAGDGAGGGAVVADPEGNGLLTPLGRACLAAGGRPDVSVQATVDLGASEDAIRTGVRRRYRTLINKGRKNLRMVYVNGGNCDYDLFEDYRGFHRRIAGRSTRPRESWDIMFETVAKGRGELSFGYDDEDRLMSCSLVIDGTEVAIYASGVYDREHFGQPLGHWPMYDAILRARKRGLSRFDLGEVPAAGTATEKEVSIGNFKRGFTSCLEARLNWILPALAQPSQERS